MFKIREFVSLVLLLFQKYSDDDTSYYASSLSFYTIFALLPTLVLLFAVIASLDIFNLYIEIFKDYILSLLLPINEKELTQYINQFLSNTDSLGYMGVAYALFVSIMLFKDYEHLVGRILEQEARSFYHSFGLYLFILIFIPVTFLLYFYISIFLETFLHHQIIIFLLVWVIFFILYLLSCNRKFLLKSLVFSSFIASFSWYIAKILFIIYIKYNVTYVTIYGSFSVLIIFFLWIYFSWMIYLHGLKILYKIDKYYLKK